MILHLKKFVTKKCQKLKKFSLPWEMVLPRMLGTVLLRLKVKCSPTMLDLTHEVFFLIAILNYWLLKKCRVHRERTWCTYSPSPGPSGASANLSCNKKTGGKQRLHDQKWSRGHLFIVRGGGIIDKWSPLFK